MSFIQQISHLTTVQYPPLSLIKWEIESFTDSPAVLVLNIEVYICLAVYVYKKNYLANLSQCLTISTLATNLPYNISIAYVSIYILWVLHLPGQLFQHLGRFCGIYDNVSWVFYGRIWQMVLDVDLFLHWLQFSHIQYIHFQHDVFVRDLPINTSR